MDSNPFAFFPVLPGSRIRIIAIGEMTEDFSNWREIHRRELARFQPYDIHMARRRQRSASSAPASQPSPASPAPSPPPAPSRRQRVLLRAPPEGEDSRPVPSAPPALRSRAPSPPGPQGASPHHQCGAPPDWAYRVEGRMILKCERCQQRFRHSIVACRNCQQRTACCSCVLQISRGDPDDNRCPGCLYL